MYLQLVPWLTQRWHQISLPPPMGGELSKREGVLFRSFQSEAKSFSRFFHRFAQIYTLITISLLDIRFK